MRQLLLLIFCLLWSVLYPYAQNGKPFTESDLFDGEVDAAYFKRHKIRQMQLIEQGSGGRRYIVYFNRMGSIDSMNYIKADTLIYKRVLTYNDHNDLFLGITSRPGEKPDTSVTNWFYENRTSKISLTSLGPNLASQKQFFMNKRGEIDSVLQRLSPANYSNTYRLTRITRNGTGKIIRIDNNEYSVTGNKLFAQTEQFDYQPGQLIATSPGSLSRTIIYTMDSKGLIQRYFFVLTEDGNEFEKKNYKISYDFYR